MTLRLLDADVATIAAQHVAESNDQKLAKRFARLRVGLHSSGLAATYLYCIAHKESPHDAFETAGLVIQQHLNLRQNCVDAEHVHDTLAKTSSAEVLRVTRRVAMVFQWIARLAAASAAKQPMTDDESDTE